MTASLSKALSAIRSSNSTPSIKRGDADRIEAVSGQERETNAYLFGARV
jgi:hypothetical protein